MTAASAAPLLNPQQEAVRDFILNKDGSLNLIARAGCGKTFTLMHGAVKTIVDNGLGTVAIMAFNKSAADEFKARLKALGAAYENPMAVAAGTVHSFGFGAWRAAARNVKVDGDKVWALINKRTDMNRSNIYAEFGGSIKALVSLAKQAAIGFLQSIDDRAAWMTIIDHHGIESNGSQDAIIDAAIEVYRESLRLDREVIDFDDMILAPLIHGTTIWPYDWVLIDEAQDTNPARRALALKMLKPETGRLIAVGDDRQAIYGFTGADADALDLIRNELNSAILPLNITYRCPKAVVTEANKIISDICAADEAPEGIVRKTLDLIAEGEGDSRTVTRWFMHEHLTGNDAVLCRNTKPLVAEAYRMIGKGIGCRVEGRDIGEGLVALATRWKRNVTIGALLDSLATYQATETQKWLAKGKETQAQMVEDRCETLRLICKNQIAAGQTSIESVVAFIRRLFGDTKEGERPAVVTLSTIHKAKGREWDRVYILGRRKYLPSRWARKEWQLIQEANLEYVAVTRAKRELIDVIETGA